MNAQGALLRLVKLAVLPHGLLFRERRPGLVILIYHRVGGGTDSDIDLPDGLFGRQMAYLRARRRPVALDDVAPGLRPAAGTPGDDVVAVTFDDGAREIYEVAFPLLLRSAIPATVYLATDYVEARRPFDFGDYARGHRPAPLTWAQVREMVASGLVTVGAHTHTHVDLSQLSERAAREELTRSRGLIEDRVGVAVRHFAYPWGTVTPATRRLVGEYFATGVRGGSAKNIFAALDPLALWRQPVQQADGFWLFRLRLDSYLDGEEFFRRLAGRFLAGRAATGDGEAPADRSMAGSRP